MKLTRVPLKTELHTGSGTPCVFYASDNRVQLDTLAETHAGRIKLIYMDPPYLTGERFHMRVRVGSADWSAGRSSLTLNTFADPSDRIEYLSNMRKVLEKCRTLLSPDGTIFVHIDYRLHPHMHLLLDEVFGEENFLNEIIWSYQSGGRSTRHFSRKHDIILFYSRSSDYDFNLEEVMIRPEAPRTNHMRRHVDPDGRVYRSIRVGGKVYTYYDDDPVAPSDVWTDVSHLQQRDPERTGYDTQKPLALLNRIVRCASRPGETVLDPFCGSGTTLEAACRAGRESIGIDSCTPAANIIRRRMDGTNFRIEFTDTSSPDDPVCEIHLLPGVGFYHVTLDRFEPLPGIKKALEDSRDAIDSWSVGYIINGEYQVHDSYIRSKKEPNLRETLNVPAYTGQLAMCVNDILGRSFLYEITPEL